MIERLLHQVRPREVVAYDPSFDREAYQKAKAEDISGLNSYTKRQIETHLGERFNVLLSTTRLDIRNGRIYPQGAIEPFLDMLIRGRNYRRLHGNPVDFDREEAEVIGYAKSEEGLLSGEIGDMRLSISRPGNEGTIYKHNFYDIFTVKQDEGGKYIEAKRYSSGLSHEETVGKLREASIIDQDSSPTAEEFLANPIAISPKTSVFKTSDDIHRFLHKDHEFTSNEDFDEAKRIITTLIVSTVNRLSENPFDEDGYNNDLNAVLNGMDVAMEIVVKNKNIPSFSKENISEMFEDKDFVHMLATKPVRQVTTGCGSSGGFGISNSKEMMNSPFSVLQSSKLKSSEKQILCCTCPFCNKEVEAEIGGGKIVCPNCRKSASWNN